VRLPPIPISIKNLEMDFTKVLAIYGSVTGTIALFFGAIGAYNNLKDRPWLKIKFRVLTPRHGKIGSGSRNVIVDLANVGRRRALTYPPVIEYISSLWDCFVTHSPDEVWQIGDNWISISDTGDPPDLDKIEEYETCTYLYHLPAKAKLIRVRVTDSLDRHKIEYTFLGSLWLYSFRFKKFMIYMRERFS